MDHRRRRLPRAPPVPTLHMASHTNKPPTAADIEAEVGHSIQVTVEPITVHPQLMATDLSNRLMDSLPLRPMPLLNLIKEHTLSSNNGIPSRVSHTTHSHTRSHTCIRLCHPNPIRTTPSNPISHSSLIPSRNHIPRLHNLNTASHTNTPNRNMGLPRSSGAVISHHLRTRDSLVAPVVDVVATVMAAARRLR